MISPVYVDGPLKGTICPASGAPVQAIEHDEDAQFMDPGHVVTYTFRQYAFRPGGKAVPVWPGFCHGEPDAEAACRALFSPEVMERAGGLARRAAAGG